MNALRKIEIFNEAIKEARSSVDQALKELERTAHEQKVHERYARMYVARLQRAIKYLGHSPSLAVSSERDTTKDGGERPLDLGMFDENDGESEEEHRMWSARDAADMRRDFQREDEIDFQ